MMPMPGVQQLVVMMLYIYTHLPSFYLAQVPKVYGTYVHSDVSASTPVDHTQIDLYVLG